MYKRTKIIFIFLFLLTLSSCTKDAKVSENDWQNEVLFATECGHDGLQCCVGEDSLCLYGQECCVDPNDPNATYCADTCTYGAPNTFCRNEDPKCDDGSVCYEGYCQIAGGNGQPCFENEICNEASICSDGICVECGLANNPCCDDKEYSCKNENNLDNTRTDCIGGRCVKCGYASESACETEPFCNPNHLKNNNICLLCGADNKPCCYKEGESFCNDGLECQSGFCF